MTTTYDFNAAAKASGLSISKFYDQIQQGHISYQRHEGRVTFTDQDIDSLRKRIQSGSFSRPTLNLGVAGYTPTEQLQEQLTNAFGHKSAAEIERGLRELIKTQQSPQVALEICVKALEKTIQGLGDSAAIVSTLSAAIPACQEYIRAMGEYHE